MHASEKSRCSSPRRQKHGSGRWQRPTRGRWGCHRRSSPPWPWGTGPPAYKRVGGVNKVLEHASVAPCPTSPAAPWRSLSGPCAGTGAAACRSAGTDGRATPGRGPAREGRTRTMGSPKHGPSASGMTGRAEPKPDGSGSTRSTHISLDGVRKNHRVKKVPGVFVRDPPVCIWRGGA